MNTDYTIRETRGVGGGAAITTVVDRSGRLIEIMHLPKETPDELDTVIRNAIAYEHERLAALGVRGYG